jgi:predicted glycoside hydrolase/deacetylase ChbG (UPF0249 family)
MTRARSLIVNADDLGLSEGVTDGIIQTMQRGIVTSTSLLANGPQTEAAVRRLGEIGCRSIGIHLNLTSGRPIGPIPTRLLAPGGAFSGPARVWSLGVLGRLPGSAIEAELGRQIEAVKGLGVAVSHLDGHHHIHVLPQIAPIVAALARAHGIPAIRLPWAIGPGGVGLTRCKWWLIRRCAARARGVFADAGLCMPDHFVAWYARGHRTRDELMTALDGLPPGVSELAVHPGRRDDTLAAMDRYVEQRPLELAALCDPAVRRHLHERGITLTSFADLCSEVAGRPDVERDGRSSRRG